MSWKKIGIILLMAAFSFGAVAIGLRVGVYEVLRQEGPDAALDHSRQMYFQKQNFQALFQLAWSFYSKGELTRADGLVDKMLYQEDWVLEDKLKANCYYLKGVISRIRGEFPEAISFYFRAKDLYERLEEDSNVFKVNLETARIYINMGDLRIAQAILDESLTIAQEYDLNLGYYYYLMSSLEFSRSDWHAALDFSQRSYEAYEEINDRQGCNSMLSSMGFYTMLLGDLERGLDLTMEAQSRIKAMGDTSQYHYNLLNLVLYARCGGNVAVLQARSKGPGAGESYIDQIASWAEKHDDQELGFYLDFVFEYDCKQSGLEIQPISEGEAPPPD